MEGSPPALPFLDGLFDGEKVCPHCQAKAVEFDTVQGFSVCSSCGKVLQETELVPAVVMAEEAYTSGVYVAPDDTGLEASAKTFGASAGGKTIQRTRPTSQLPLYRDHVERFIDKLSLDRTLRAQAMDTMQRLINAEGRKGQWRREVVAIVSIYVAIRQNCLPLTLLDMAAASHVNVYVIGRYYQAALRTLQVTPPPVRSADLLDRMLIQVVADREMRACVEEDAKLGLEWIDKRLHGSRHPLVMVGVAILLALDINNVVVGIAHVAKILRVSHDALHAKLCQAKEELLRASAWLPYTCQPSRKQISSHARMIFRTSKLMADALEKGKETANEIAQPSSLPATQIVPSTDVVAKPHSPSGSKRALSRWPEGEGTRRRKEEQTKREQRNGRAKRRKASPVVGAASKAQDERCLPDTVSLQSQPLDRRRTIEATWDGDSLRHSDDKQGRIDDVKIAQRDARCDDADENGLWSDDELDDAELDNYLRTDEEVGVYKELWHASRKDG
jgi:transcription initiation factor TFIIIB Brf1 subunit/transcription initiation factor TFIIB